MTSKKQLTVYRMESEHLSYHLDVNAVNKYKVYVLKKELQDLCKKLGEYGEECIVITVNVDKKSASYLGSKYGLQFLQMRLEIVQQFYQLCNDQYTYNRFKEREENTISKRHDLYQPDVKPEPFNHSEEVNIFQTENVPIDTATHIEDISDKENGSKNRKQIQDRNYQFENYEIMVISEAGLQDQILAPEHCYEGNNTTLERSNQDSIHTGDCYEGNSTTLERSNPDKFHTVDCYEDNSTTLERSNPDKFHTVDCYEDNSTTLERSNPDKFHTVDCYEDNSTALERSNRDRILTSDDINQDNIPSSECTNCNKIYTLEENFQDKNSSSENYDDGTSVSQKNCQLKTSVVKDEIYSSEQGSLFTICTLEVEDHGEISDSYSFDSEKTSEDVCENITVSEENFEPDKNKIGTVMHYQDENLLAVEGISDNEIQHSKTRQSYRNFAVDDYPCFELSTSEDNTRNKIHFAEIENCEEIEASNGKCEDKVNNILKNSNSYEILYPKNENKDGGTCSYRLYEDKTQVPDLLKFKITKLNRKRDCSTLISHEKKKNNRIHRIKDKETISKKLNLTSKLNSIHDNSANIPVTEMKNGVKEVQKGKSQITEATKALKKTPKVKGKRKRKKLGYRKKKRTCDIKSNMKHEHPNSSERPVLHDFEITRNLPNKFADSSNCDSFKTVAKNMKCSKMCKQKYHVCKFCGNRCSDLNKFIFHMTTHVTEKGVLCNICGKVLQSERNLKMHKLIHTCNKECSECNIRFKSSKELQKHTRSLHEKTEKPICDICGIQLCDRNGLQVHARRHTGEKPFKCNICEKDFRTKSACNGHMIVHSDEKKYECRICGKKYKWPQKLNTHVKFIHTGLKPFNCQFCGKAFNRKDNLKVHENSHKK